MKKTILFSLFLLISSLGFGQNEEADSEEYNSLLKLKNTRGYASFHAGSLNSSDESLVLRSGGSAAVIFNHNFALGVSGTAFTGFQNTSLNGEQYSMLGGYGGLFVEPILFPKSPIHVSFPVGFGAGQNQFFKDEDGYRDWDIEYQQDYIQDFVYLEPGINLELNLTKFMRFGITGSYLVTNTLNNSPIDKKTLDGFSASANLKFGWFK